MKRKNRKICIVIPDLGGGGAEQVILAVCRGLIATGCQLDLILFKHRGALLPLIPDGLQLFTFDLKYFLQCPPFQRNASLRLAIGPRWFRLAYQWLPNLIRLHRQFPSIFNKKNPRETSLRHSVLATQMAVYLNQEKPDTVFAALPLAHIVCLLGQHLANPNPIIIASIHNVVTPNISVPMMDDMPESHKQYCFSDAAIEMQTLALLPDADWVHSVSQGVANDLLSKTKINKKKMAVIYNPVFSEAIYARAKQRSEHPWFWQRDERKMLISVGRLQPEKDHMTLLRAFHIVLQQYNARLVILGEGPGRPMLEALAKELGVWEQVAMPGFVANPFSFLARSDIFILSSRYESFGNVLVEAMACGCPVVSTDCPHGPREILQDGRYGPLVPPGKPKQLAEAIVATLAQPPDPARLVTRAKDFSEVVIFPQYQKLFGIFDTQHDIDSPATD